MMNLRKSLGNWYRNIIIDNFTQGIYSDGTIDTLYVLRNAYKVADHLVFPELHECLDRDGKWYASNMDDLIQQLQLFCDELKESRVAPVAYQPRSNSSIATSWLYCTHNKPENISELPPITKVELHRVLKKVSVALDNSNVPPTLKRLKAPLAKDIITTFEVVLNRRLSNA